METELEALKAIADAISNLSVVIAMTGIAIVLAAIGRRR